jgi:CRISPR-associated protein Csb1
MTADPTALPDAPRLLLEADLRPAQGSRFQTTGFPDLGPAEYEGPDGAAMLLVESAQSMANRLERVCWDEANDDLAGELEGLPYVRVDLGGLGSTTSLLEFHRLNSPYVCEASAGGGEPFREVLAREVGLRQARQSRAERSQARRSRRARPAGGEAPEAAADGPEAPGVLSHRRLAEVLFRYDPNSLVHGVFLEKVEGRLRLPRALSAFIEARGVRPAESGGVKFDRVNPSGDTTQGFGHVPFHRTEYTAEKVTAYFSLDLAQLRGYGLPPEALDLLFTLSLWKVRRLLDGGLRLRSACDLDVVSFKATRPEGFAVPAAAELTKRLRPLLDSCQEKGLFAAPPVTPLSWQPPRRTSRARGEAAAAAEGGGEE